MHIDWGHINYVLAGPTWAAGLVWTTFCIWYTIRAKWWRVEIGRNIFSLAFIIAFVFTRLSIVMFTYRANIYQPVSQSILGGVIYTAVAGIGVRRIIQMEQSQRRSPITYGRRRDDIDPPPGRVYNRPSRVQQWYDSRATENTSQVNQNSNQEVPATVTDEIVPIATRIAAKRGFIRTTAQAYAATIPAGGVSAAVLLNAVNNPDARSVIITIAATLLSPPLAGLASYLSITSKGIPEDYTKGVTSPPSF